MKYYTRQEMWIEERYEVEYRDMKQYMRKEKM